MGSTLTEVRTDSFGHEWRGDEHIYDRCKLCIAMAESHDDTSHANCDFCGAANDPEVLLLMKVSRETDEP